MSFVYFVAPEAVFHRDDSQVVKIGYTRNHPRARLRNLQCGSPIQLSLLGYTDGPPDLERAFHRTFAACGSHGEWFHLYGKLFDFIGYLGDNDRREKYTPRALIAVSVFDNILASSSPHPSMSDAEYLAAANPEPLRPYFPDEFLERGL
jgi:hypothetical protein